MKFLEGHRSDVIRSVEKYGFDRNYFSYVKRKGRIFICTEDPEVAFGYLRKKSTRLDPNTKQWVHSTSYKVQINRKPQVEVNEWSEVMKMFHSWLQEIRAKMNT